MFLHAIASALPPASYTQAEVLAHLRQSAPWRGLRDQSRELLEKILSGESGIERRHFANTHAEALLSAGPQELNRAFEVTAPALASRALERALQRGAVAAREVDAVFVCTCTGYLCPGPSSYIAEGMGLRDDVVLHDLVGLGCGAAIPTLRAASHFLAAHPEATAAVVAVEVCSAAFFLNDDPSVLVSLCLFGDGASASLWRGQSRAAATQWQARGFRSLHRPAEREKIRFVNDQGKLKNKLHRSVPAVAAAAVLELFGKDHANGSAANVCVVAHGGGRDVITALREALPKQELAFTTEVLRHQGNMSSPSVLFALERALNENIRSPLWLTAFGAGFAAHSCRLERHD
ncbi:MAG: type III polyketide synthase [Verrucomicrobiales bacterium]